MRVQMFTIYDKKMEVYQAPMYSHNVGTMMRTLSDSLSRSDTMMSRFPDDYVLNHIGVFDDVTGEITPFKQIAFVCKLEDLIERSHKDGQTQNN